MRWSKSAKAHNFLECKSAESSAMQGPSNDDKTNLLDPQNPHTVRKCSTEIPNFEWRAATAPTYTNYVCFSGLSSAQGN